LPEEKSPDNEPRTINLADDEAKGAPPRIGSRWKETRLTLRILLENKSSALGLIIVTAYAFIAIMDFVYPRAIGVQDAYSLIPSFGNLPVPPSAAHIFGTTYDGIDLYQAVMSAIRVDLW
jgi:ABC-type dipeptide/oligopeptide/nickel transport system permease subunit